MQINQPAHFGPLVECCAAYGISRTISFELARKGLLETFSIGTRRYVLLDSLWTLPEKMRTLQGGQS